MANLENSEVAPAPKPVVKPTLDELCQQVEAITDPAKRKAFFLSHPELEARYSFANFIP